MIPVCVYYGTGDGNDDASTIEEADEMLEQDEEDEEEDTRMNALRSTLNPDQLKLLDSGIFDDEYEQASPEKPHEASIDMENPLDNYEYLETRQAQFTLFINCSGEQESMIDTLARPELKAVAEKCQLTPDHYAHITVNTLAEDYTPHTKDPTCADMTRLLGRKGTNGLLKKCPQGGDNETCKAKVTKTKDGINKNAVRFHCKKYPCHNSGREVANPPPGRDGQRYWKNQDMLGLDRIWAKTATDTVILARSVFPDKEQQQWRVFANAISDHRHIVHRLLLIEYHRAALAHKEEEGLRMVDEKKKRTALEAVAAPIPKKKKKGGVLVFGSLGRDGRETPAAATRVPKNTKNTPQTTSTPLRPSTGQTRLGGGSRETDRHSRPQSRPRQMNERGHSMSRGQRDQYHGGGRDRDRDRSFGHDSRGRGRTNGGRSRY